MNKNIVIKNALRGVDVSIPRNICINHLIFLVVSGGLKITPMVVGDMADRR
jgi:hypothetical protein